MVVDKSIKTRNLIFILAIVFSLIFYISGVFSGLFVKHAIQEDTKNDIDSLRFKTEGDLIEIQNDIGDISNSFESLQLEQLFYDSLSKKDACIYLRNSIEDLSDNLRKYWGILPYRLEEFEKSADVLPPEYIEIKKQYMLLSIKTWILTNKYVRTCHSNSVVGLYFYSSDCDNCVQQGEHLDVLKNMLSENNVSFFLFTVDSNSSIDVIQKIKEYYSINSTPSLILNDGVFTDQVYNSTDLWSYLDSEGVV